MDDDTEDLQDAWEDIRAPQLRKYAGTRSVSEGTCLVFVFNTRNQSKPLPLYSNVANHSPTGFEWGYEGSGPAQLALAILCDHFGKGRASEQRALKLHQAFKVRFIAKLEHSVPWIITSDDVRRFVEEDEPKIGSD